MKGIHISEGGYVNHPKDPGGATNFGVTQRVYDSYRKDRGQSARSVKQITSDEVATSTGRSTPTRSGTTSCQQESTTPPSTEP